MYLYFFVPLDIRKKTIYEYHRVTFNRDEIKNWTVIYMKALPTCVNLNDCHSCLNHNTNFSVSNFSDLFSYSLVSPTLKCAL